MSDNPEEPRSYRYKKDNFPNSSALATELICDSIAQFPQRGNEPHIICAYNLVQGQQNGGISIKDFANTDIDYDLAVRKMDTAHKAYDIKIPSDRFDNKSKPRIPELESPDFIYGFGFGAIAAIFTRTKKLFSNQLPPIIASNETIDNERPPGRLPHKQYLKQDVIESLSNFIAKPEVARTLLNDLEPEYSEIKARAVAHRKQEQSKNKASF